MDSDIELSQRVSAELGRLPGLRASSIDVTASNGTVTLKGTVPDYDASCLASRAVKRVAGVECLVNELTVAS